MSNVTPLPEVGRIRLGNVRTLPWAWKVRWEDVEGRDRASFVRGPCEPHVARLAVASYNEDFYEFIGEPVKVVKS